MTISGEDLEKLSQIIHLAPEVGVEFGRQKLKMNPNQKSLRQSQIEDAARREKQPEIAYETFVGRLGRVWVRRRFIGPSAIYPTNDDFEFRRKSFLKVAKEFGVKGKCDGSDICKDNNEDTTADSTLFEQAVVRDYNDFMSDHDDDEEKDPEGDLEDERKLKKRIAKGFSDFNKHSGHNNRPQSGTQNGLNR